MKKLIVMAIALTTFSSCATWTKLGCTVSIQTSPTGLCIGCDSIPGLGTLIPKAVAYKTTGKTVKIKLSK